VDGNNNRHRISVAVSGTSTGVNTVSAYFHAGTSGSLNPVLVAYDTGFSNSQGAIFSLSDGSFVAGTQHAGSGAIISTGSQSLASGWWRVWATFSLGAAPASAEIQVAQGSNNFFTGNSADNLLVWGATMRAGNLP
jgi:hypothetical protein